MMFDHIDSYRGTAVTAQMIVRNIGNCTVGGWIWYCDVHDSHGNADSEDEAKYMAIAHEGFFDDGEEFEGCDLMVSPAVEVDDV